MVEGQARSTGFSVAEVARRADMNPSAVRYYERRGLLPRQPRTPAGYRVLAADTVERLRFIRQAQALGLRLAEIREVLHLRDHGAVPCNRVQQLAVAQLAAIEEKLTQLRQLRRSLRALLETPTVPAEGRICGLIEAAQAAPAVGGSKVPRLRNKDHRSR